MNDEAENLSANLILGRVIAAIEDALRHATFDFRGNNEATILLFLSALENAKAFVILNQPNSSFASVSNARSAFEALLDACAMMKDDQHLERMHQIFLHQKRNALVATIALSKEFPSESLEKPDLWQKQLNELDKEIARTSKVPKKRREELITEHLEAGGLLSLWGVLCDVSHNNINSLAVRHLEKNSGRERIILYAPLEKRLSEAIVLTLSVLLVDIATLIANFVTSGQDDYGEYMRAAASHLWWTQGLK